MSEPNGATDKTVYRVEGFTCANCAGKFERNVKQIPGVHDAIVNFGASKITVVGQATVEELEHAGAFENLKIRPDRRSRAGSARGRGGEADQSDATEERQDTWNKQRSTLLFSILLVGHGFVSLFENGHDNLVTRLLFAASIGIGGYSLLKTGLGNLRRLEFDMRTLMTIAIIGAAIIGEWAEGAVVVILFAISEALERYSMDRARRSIRSLMTIAPQEALVRRDGREVMMDVDDIAVGDMIIVKPGEKIAMDGVVVAGYSAVNQAAITGESAPIAKQVGDDVFAGTLNEEGLLEIRVTKLVADTTIAKIIHLVEEAQAERAPAQAFVDKFARVYTPLIMLTAALVAIVPPLLGGDWATWIYQGLSVLVVGCPCALVISTPISIVSAIGTAARHGVLIKGGIHLEELGGIRAIALDKTGTLTKGSPAVTDVEVYGAAGAQEQLARIAALESRSRHPLAGAVVRYAEQMGAQPAEVEVEAFRSLTGKGLQGEIDGDVYYVGNMALFRDQGIELSGQQHQLVRRLQHEGKTVMLAGTKRGITAILGAADEIRESSAGAIDKLQQLGIRHMVMLTGDNEATARALADRLGLSDVQAELMPQDKLDAIKRLRDTHGKAAMVGDGVNDAPALAAATVGVAMGGAGTDTALETADIALMGDDLGKLPFAIRLSRRTLAIIKQNITFALAIKLLALILVVPGWLTLWIAIMSDMGATLLVALNSMRLMRVKE